MSDVVDVIYWDKYFQRPSLRQWRLSRAGPLLTERLWKNMKCGCMWCGLIENKHFIRGHEGCADSQRILFSFNKNSNNLPTWNAVRNGSSSRCQSLTHTLSTREHCKERKKWLVVNRWMGINKQNLMAPLSAWKRGSMKGSVKQERRWRERREKRE